MRGPATCYATNGHSRMYSVSSPTGSVFVGVISIFSNTQSYTAAGERPRDITRAQAAMLLRAYRLAGNRIRRVLDHWPNRQKCNMCDGTDIRLAPMDPCTRALHLKVEAHATRNL